jgi:hypothetical protein
MQRTKLSENSQQEKQQLYHTMTIVERQHREILR